jgi:hypothetical protein
MSVAAGPNIIRNGLVLCLDAGNNKSFKGEPTINLYAYYGFQEIGNGGTHSAVRYTGPAPDLNIPNNYDYFTCTTTSSWAAELNRWLPFMQSANTPGVLDTNFFTISFYARVTSQQTATIGASFYGNNLQSNGSDINFNLTDKWQRFSIYANAPTIYKNFEFGSRSGAIVFQVAGLQLESKTYATPYVNNTRGNSVDTGGGLFDLTSKGNNGTLINGVKYSDLNKGSLVFDGVNDEIIISPNDLYKFTNTQPFSFSTWLRYTNIGGAATIISFSLNNEASRGYYLMLIEPGVNNRFFFDYWDGGPFRGIEGNLNSILSNEWIYLVATSSSNSVNDMKVYQNGVLTSFTNRGSDNPSTIDYNELSLKIGSRGASYFFQGSISQLSIYNRALTPTEILQNYNATKGRFKLT